MVFSRSKRLCGFLISVALVSACVDLADEPQHVGPMDVFASQLQPQLATRCASAACHGRTDRPLALFSPGAYRMDASRQFLDESLTAEELSINAYQTMAFASGDTAASSLIVTKPLSTENGGTSHGGGTVFGNTDDALYLALVDWIELGLQQR